ncbi:MAG: hypothetical protein QUV06_14045 [Cyanobium sp. CZS 48M]|nr:hypothetical protein [Cyanobium sp. CZS48M]
MIYLDTSVVIALLTPEERSPHALNWFEQRRHGLTPQAPQAAVELFERLLQGGAELQQAPTALALNPALS